jgi:hypothetical protein
VEGLVHCILVGYQQARWLRVARWLKVKTTLYVQAVGFHTNHRRVVCAPGIERLKRATAFFLRKGTQHHIRALAQ